MTTPVDATACETRERDGCAVPTEPLATLVVAFVDRWNKERPPASRGQFSGPARRRRSSRPERDTMGALEWLAQETGYKVTTLKPLTLRNRKTGQLGRTPTTELRVADRIVNAIGYEFAFHDGTLEIMPNPNARKELRAACCGGST